VLQFNALAGVIPCEYPDKLYLSRNWSDCPTWCWKLHDRTFIRLDKTPERDGQTGRQTEMVWLLQRSALQAMWTRCNKSRTVKFPDAIRCYGQSLQTIYSLHKVKNQRRVRTG